MTENAAITHAAVARMIDHALLAPEATAAILGGLPGD
jgi:hypothetical protein